MRSRRPGKSRAYEAAKAYAFALSGAVETIHDARGREVAFIVRNADTVSTTTKEPRQ